MEGGCWVEGFAVGVEEGVEEVGEETDADGCAVWEFAIHGLLAEFGFVAVPFEFLGVAIEDGGEGVGVGLDDGFGVGVDFRLG